jgi:ribulose 1,5-bisphosphate synthetase/thiazole synthase
LYVAYLSSNSSRGSIGRIDAAYDLVVIGAGSAGLVAAPFASAVGAKVLLVEKDRGRLYVDGVRAQ